MMEKRFLAAIVLCLLILVIYQSYMGKRQALWKAQQEASQQANEETPSSLPANTGFSDASQRQDGSLPRPLSIPAGAEAMPSAAGDLTCDEVVVDTPLYRAALCSYNGRLMSWKLKRYQVIESCGCPLVSLFAKDKDCGSEEPGPANWVERIHARGPDEYPLGIEISAGGNRQALQEMLTPDSRSLALQEGGGQSRIVFSGQDAAGRKVRRTYSFSPDLYRVDLQIEIEGITGTPVESGLGLSLTERIESAKADKYTFAGFMGLVNGKLVKEKKANAGEDKFFNGQVAWEGFSDKYFLSCLIPVDNPVSSVILDYHSPRDGEVDGLWGSRLVYNIQAHTQEGVGRFAYSLFIGPKAMKVLKANGHSMQDSIDLGWFGFIAEPLLAVLEFFYKYTHNYGIAIILLTVLIKILFHPLTHKQYQSMKQMQNLQPKMQELREKHKNDRQKLNEEVMALYRTHKINPLGGCWPMLLQIPVFFALYKALLNSIELRQAPFMFWIQDLSTKDPCYITPIIMGATMFLQQKMTPSVGDPNQQKMMMFMPVIFTFLFLNFPSGLVLYWLVNNVITIGQQYVSQRRKR